ncbi:MAG: hypothetical protein M1827_006617 [Pycnora praestabilis]|nr:MAG: hypothetical protein M1827_006617 [Pycnora praestabilis]
MTGMNRSVEVVELISEGEYDFPPYHHNMPPKAVKRKKAASAKKSEKSSVEPRDLKKDSGMRQILPKIYSLSDDGIEISGPVPFPKMRSDVNLTTVDGESISVIAAIPGTSEVSMIDLTNEEHIKKSLAYQKLHTSKSVVTPVKQKKHKGIASRVASPAIHIARKRSRSTASQDKASHSVTASSFREYSRPSTPRSSRPSQTAVRAQSPEDDLSRIPFISNASLDLRQAAIAADRNSDVQVSSIFESRYGAVTGIVQENVPPQKGAVRAARQKPLLPSVYDEGCVREGESGAIESLQINLPSLPILTPVTTLPEGLSFGNTSIGEYELGSGESAPVPGTLGSETKEKLKDKYDEDAAIISPEEPDRRSKSEDESTPLVLSYIEDIMKRHLRELHEDHEYFMKGWLKRARRGCDRRAVKNQPLVSDVTGSLAAGYSTTPARFVDQQSPFLDMRGIQFPTQSKGAPPSKDIGKLTQEAKAGQVVKITGGKSDKTYLSVPLTTYASDAVTVPAYTSYITLRRNLLAENDKNLLYWPYFGDEVEKEKSSLFEELELRFQNRIRDLPRRRLRSEQALKFAPYVKRFLSEVGCGVADVLYYFIQPKESYFNRDQKKWIGLFERLPKPQHRALALAGLASRAFFNVAGFSIWHVIKSKDVLLEPLSLEKLAADTPSILLQESKMNNTGSNLLGTYTDLCCLVCHAHDCPGHGEYVYQDSDSETDEDGAINVRKRVIAESLVLKAHNKRKNLPKLKEDETPDLMFYRGLEEDGLIKGFWDDGDVIRIPGLPDTELCSPKCSWKKKNRSPLITEWEPEQKELLKTLLPAWTHSRRGACAIAQTVQKPCFEIFAMICSSLPPTEDFHRPSLSQKDGIRTLPKPKGWQYWERNSKTHSHDDRKPFTPCSHDGSCRENICTCFKENVTCEKTCACSIECDRRFRGCTCAKGEAGKNERICWQSARCDCYRLNRECDEDLCGSCGSADVLNPVNRYNDEVAASGCSNVYMQRSIPKRTLLGHSEIQGWGLYMGEPVKSHEFLGEYVGEVISKEEGNRRGAVYAHRETMYLFKLNSEQEIDSTRAGNKFRFINNSRLHNNCYPKKMFCNTVQRIGMYASRDIAVGEELFFNYGYPKEATKHFREKGEHKTSAQLFVVKTTKTKTTTGKQGGARRGAGRKPRIPKATTTTPLTLTSTSSTAINNTLSSPPGLDGLDEEEEEEEEDIVMLDNSVSDSEASGTGVTQTPEADDIARSMTTTKPDSPDYDIFDLEEGESDASEDDEYEEVKPARRKGGVGRGVGWGGARKKGKRGKVGRS